MAALSSASMSAVDAALKNDYQPMIREQLTNVWVLLSQLETNTKDVQGRYAVLSLHVGRNAGVGARGTGVALPVPGNQDYAEQRVPVKRNYAAIGIPGDLVAASASDKGSFGRHLDLETKGAMTDLKNDVSRQVYGDSTKAIAQCGTTTAANVVVLATTTSAVQMRQFHVGMRVDIGTTADYDVVAANRTITAIDKTNKTITVDGAAVTTSSSHYVTRQGSDGNEITGLRQIVASSGTLFNVDPSVDTSWVSVVNDASGVNRPPTELLFEKVIEDVNQESGEDPNLIVTTRGVRRNLAQQYQGQRRYTDTVEIKAGFSAVTVAAGNVELPLVIDNDAPANMAFVLNTAHLIHFQMGPKWGFLDRDGSVLHLNIGFDEYVAYIGNYHELATDRRNAHGLLKDLTEA